MTLILASNSNFFNFSLIKNILSKDNNKKILNNATDGQVKITICEVEESLINEDKDEILTKFSDIMGGEVINDGGRNPFD